MHQFYNRIDNCYRLPASRRKLKRFFIHRGARQYAGASLLCSLIVVLLLTGGCTRSMGICPATVPLTATDTYTKMGYTSGDSTTVAILGIPFGPANPSRVARDEAMAEKNANALIQVTEDFTVINLFIIQFYTTTVEATAIKFARRGMDVE